MKKLLLFLCLASALSAQIVGAGQMGIFGPASGGGTPGGSNGDWQYNNAGSFGGYTPATGWVTLFGTPTSANLAGWITNETGTGVLVFSASPTFTGVPLAPTAAPGTNTTQLATTAFVLANAGSSVHSVSFSFSGGGSPLTTGVSIPKKVGYGGTLVKYTFNCTPSGSVTFNVFRSANGAGLPTASIINNAGGGGGTGTLPAIASGTEGTSTTFTNWGSTTITADDNLALNLTTVDGVVQGATLTLYYQ
jgi:hypothetical protein